VKDWWLAANGLTVTLFVPFRSSDSNANAKCCRCLQLLMMSGWFYTISGYHSGGALRFQVASSMTAYNLGRSVISA